MSLIQFEDLPSTNTPITASNLNNNFNELATMALKNYALGYTINNQTVTGTAWSIPTVPLTDFSTNNSSLFEKDGDKIKVKENGTYLIIISKETTINNDEQDCYIFGGTTIGFTSYKDSATFIAVKELNANDKVFFGLNTSLTSYILRNASLLVIKM